MSTAMTPFQATWAPRAIGALRIVAGYLFIAHSSRRPTSSCSPTSR